MGNYKKEHCESKVSVSIYVLISKCWPASLYENLEEDELRAKKVCEIRKLIVISILGV